MTAQCLGGCCIPIDMCISIDIQQCGEGNAGRSVSEKAVSSVTCLFRGLPFTAMDARMWQVTPDTAFPRTLHPVLQLPDHCKKQGSAQLAKPLHSFFSLYF